MSSTTASRRKSTGESPCSRTSGTTLLPEPVRPPASQSGPLVPLIRFGGDREFCITCARPGDHHMIHRLLISVLHQPSEREFQAQQEDPFYEPIHRLVIRRGEQIIGHVHLLYRETHFGNLILPSASLSDVAILPEFRGQGCEAELLRAAEQAIVANGSQLAFLKTRQPEFLLQCGWAIGPRHSYSAANAREILSMLHQQEDVAPDPLGPQRVPLNIRMWRHVEQAALMRLYAAHCRDAYGPLVRSHDFWRWLVSRRAYDRIYVAIEGPDRLELDDTQSPIVGYAVMREGRILELVAVPGHDFARRQLLARACGDAIEHDLHHVRLDAPPDEPLHRLIEAAGGRKCFHEADNGEVTMVKLFQPLQFLQQRFNWLHQAAKEAALELPCELGLSVDGTRLALSVRPRSVRLQEGKLGRSYLECSTSTLTQLLLGHLDVREAAALGRLTASTRLAIEVARILFPPLPLWRPPLDELQA